ncbi:hypothetical protein RUM44_010642 [Polyplax serrata]|uniref:PHD-type domain-containing protein n=1 Tax=Polyplax serrata TaxID=468196 RepID=A0ABR1AMR9_POLSC
MNDFLTKLLLEKQEKGSLISFKSLEEKKKSGCKDIFYDFNSELDERIKRDAMSQYQEDKSHHKRSSTYGDLNQWDFRNQQDIQNANNHTRRGHFPFGGSSQGHSMGWNPLGMGMPRQTNPYFPNPHMMPAHAHAEYRYNQWNSPSQKNVPNIQNAHSQNTILAQSRMDGKHRPDISNSLGDFGLPTGTTADFSKLRNNHRDLMGLRGQTVDKSSVRTPVHPDHLASMSPMTRNPASRTSSLSNHPKAMIGNPLTDLQLLVTNQENDSSGQKSDGYQQESVDLSAHSEASKNKNSIRKEEKLSNDSNTDKREHRTFTSVSQTQNKKVSSAEETCHTPVELTAKNNEKVAGTEISSSSVKISKVENNCSTDANAEKSKSEKELTKASENLKDNCDKPCVVDKDTTAPVNNAKSEECIPKKGETSSSESTGKEAENSQKDTKVKEESDNNGESMACDLPKAETNSMENPKECQKELDQNGTHDIQTVKRKMSEEQPGNDTKRTCMDIKTEVPEGNTVREENPDLPTVSSTSAEVKPPVNESSKKAPKKKPSRKSRALRLSSGQSSSSESPFHNKKFLGTSSKDKKVKKSLCDTIERRGPFLHLEGSKESPSGVTVINYPKADDEDEKDKSAAKKQNLNLSRTKHHNELDYRGKSKNGLFSSTLSSRYDAHTTDHSWVCVFCKKGPHYNTLGDLFGPYIISKEESNSSTCDFSGDEKDISDAQKRGGRNKKSLRSNNMVEHFQKMSKKLRRTQSTDSSLVGMTVIPDDQTDQTRYEVWVHEQCAVWSPNVCLIGSRIVGMQEAIWSSVKTMCSKCGAFGANIGCVFRNCPNRSHYYCAKENEWLLEQETFISTCQIHKPRS